MSRYRFRIFTSIILVCMALVAIVQSEAIANPRYVEVSGIASTLAPGARDTSEVITSSSWTTVTSVVICEGDSLLYTLQGSFNGTTWFAIASQQLDGVDGTTGLQLGSTLTKTGTTSSTFSAIPPGNYVRVIVYVNDSVGSDEVTGFTNRLYYTR